MTKWLARRKVAFDAAVARFGPLSAENLRAIQKEVKRIEALPDPARDGAVKDCKEK